MLLSAGNGADTEVFPVQHDYPTRQCPCAYLCTVTIILTSQHQMSSQVLQTLEPFKGFTLRAVAPLLSAKTAHFDIVPTTTWTYFISDCMATRLYFHTRLVVSLLNLKQKHTCRFHSKHTQTCQRYSRSHTANTTCCADTRELGTSLLASSPYVSPRPTK